LAPEAVDAGWFLIAGVLIFFMQTGFALLESGSVRYKNY
jgi:ammonium transporter, Amt family